MQEMRKNSRTLRAVIFFGTLALTIVLDQLSKMLVVKNMDVGDSITLIPGVLNFTYITNSGAAMGMLSESRWLFMILSPLAIVGISVYVMLAKDMGRCYTVALSMIAGGGIGNMIDRTFNGELFHGVVVDFIDFCAFPNIWRYTFNVADVFVCVGAGLFVLAVILESVRDAKIAKVAKNDRSSDNEKGADDGT